MSRIVFSCSRGLAVQGLVKVGEPIYKVKIFLEDPNRLIGFRDTVRQYQTIDEQTKQMTQYYEIGYFMEMLYEGDLEAFEILASEGDFCYYSFEILKKRQEELISRNLINTMTKQSEEYYKVFSDPKKSSYVSQEIGDNEFLLEKLAYDNNLVYLCIRNLMIVENIYKEMSFKLPESKVLTLQGVLDGKFSLKALQDAYKLHKDNIEELDSRIDIVNVPDHTAMNNILKEIRNVRIETLNTERW